jgi:hypothetical protein
MDIPASVLICIRATHGGVHHAWVFWTRFTVIALTLGDLYIGDNNDDSASGLHNDTAL